MPKKKVQSYAFMREKPPRFARRFHRACARRNSELIIVTARKKFRRCLKIKKKEAKTMEILLLFFKAFLFVSEITFELWKRTKRKAFDDEIIKRLICLENAH